MFFASSPPSAVRQILRTFWLLLLLLPTVAAAKTPLERHLKRQNSELPQVLYYRDIQKVCLELQIIGMKKMLMENDVTFHDAKDDSTAYIRTRDLLSLCGKKCTADSEWGAFLQHFAVQIHR